jgi:prephenate dehydrogenase
MANADRLAVELAGFSKKLVEIRKLVEGGNAAALEKLFAEARDARNSWLKTIGPRGEPEA